LLKIKEDRVTYFFRRFHDLGAKALVSSSRRHLPKVPQFAVIPNDYIGRCVIGNGLYERREIELIRQLVVHNNLKGGIYLDVGGNIGNHVVAFADLFQDVITFEPNPRMAALLRANLVLTNCLNVRVHEVGLGRQDADLRFGVSEADNAGSGSFASGAGDVVLPVRHGDSFLAAHEAALVSGHGPMITLLKCDVEGLEADVFEGLRDTLARHRPIVVFESNARGSGEAAWARLREAGYSDLAVIRETGDDRSRIRQEASRLLSGCSCWLEPTLDVPERRANLVASVGPLMLG